MKFTVEDESFTLAAGSKPNGPLAPFPAAAPIRSARVFAAFKKV